MNYHIGRNHQKGQGLGSFLGSLVRRIIPLKTAGFNMGRQFLQNDLTKSLANKSLDLGKDILFDATKNIISDVLSGDSIKTSAQKELENAKKKISSAIRGGGKKRRNKNVQNLSKRQKLENKEYNLLDNDF